MHGSRTDQHASQAAFRGPTRLAPSLRLATAGFTLIEILVVISIIAFLTAIVLVVYSDSLTEARIEATRATIRQLDSALEERQRAFQRLNFRSEAQQFRVAYLRGTNTPAAPPPQEVAEIIVRKDRFRAAFPQRLQDLYGFDGVAGTQDDAPLLVKWNAAITSPGLHTPETESSELLWLALTEGSAFGPPPPNLDNIPPRHLQDTDNDGLTEIVDDWGRPLQFYNWPTRLIRPGGNNTPIVGELFASTCGPLMPDITPPTGTLPYTQYNHPLNQDPDDSTGALSFAMTSNGGSYFTSNFTLVFGSVAINALPFNEMNYHSIDTLHTPLLVSSGPDEELGLTPPTDTTPAHLAQPLGVDQLQDNITNRQR